MGIKSVVQTVVDWSCLNGRMVMNCCLGWLKRVTAIEIYKGAAYLRDG